MKNTAFAALAVLMLCGCVMPASQSKYEVQTQRVSLLGGMTTSPTAKIVDGKWLLNNQEYLGGERGKYETDQEYTDRLSSGFGQDVSFIVPLNEGSFSFNQGTGAFDVKAAVIDAKYLGYKSKEGFGREYPAIRAGLVDVPIDQYIGSNAFGVTTKVYRSAQQHFYIVIGDKDAKGGPSSYVAKGSFRIDRSDVEGSEEAFALLVNGRPEAPYVFSSESYKAPTIKDPTEALIYNHFMPMRAQSVGLINKVTGKRYEGSFYIHAERTGIGRSY